MAATALISISVININYSERAMALNITQGQFNSDFYHSLISYFLNFTYFILF